MILGAILPNNSGDKRTTLHPDSIKPILDMGIDISFESGLCKGIDLEDSVLENLGAKATDRQDCIRSSDILFSTSPLGAGEIKIMKKDSFFIGLMDPFTSKAQFEGFSQRGNSAVSMEFIPRISRAQKMDVLSSQSNLAGYVAVIESAKELNLALPMMMTAAGTLKPANIFVIGVGVAGLQAIATAKRLGAKVEAFDTREVVEEQVKSLGAKFVKIDLGATEETTQGYAKELTSEQIQKQKMLQKDVCVRSDIVITTAQIFGRPAPSIIDKETIESMKPGSVIFDMAVESVGNVEGSKINQIVNHKGVKIMGLSNLPSFTANQSSFALSNNLINFVLEFYNQEQGDLEIDFEDEIIKSALLVNKGKITNEVFK